MTVMIRLFIARNMAKVEFPVKPFVKALKLRLLLTLLLGAFMRAFPATGLIGIVCPSSHRKMR